MEGDTKLCSNCKKEISVSNYVMHEIHCRRHILLCEQCGEPIPHVKLEQHFNDVHAKVSCERCQQELPRSEIESHVESECSKMPVLCEFCELSFPKDEYGAHYDYCGSRTECCPVCQQYIMLKDMTLHETSDCMYPEPKPAPAQPAPNSDPFSMAHLQEFLDVDSRLRSSDDVPDFTGNLRREMQQFAVGRIYQSVPNRRRRSRNTASERAANENSLSSFDLQSDSSSDDSYINANNTWEEAIPPDMDYDTMLALRLAHEDWAEDNDGSDQNQQPFPNFPVTPDPEDTIPFHLQSDVDSQPQDDPDLFLGHSQKNGDLKTIPCEFCGLKIPMSTYLDHDEICNASDPAISNDVYYVDRNNELPVPNSSNQRNAIPVINNLGSERQQRHSEPSQPFDSNSFVEDIILPCEFCEEMFPSEIIVQHQSGCPANGLVTPRATTPTSSIRYKRSSHQPKSTSGGSFSTFNKSTQATKQRCQPDLEPLDPTLSDDDGPESNFFRDETYKDLLQSTSDKYSPAVDRFDDSIARPPRWSSRQLSNEESQDARMAPSDAQRPSKSAQRTRASLNQLLQENEGATATATSNAQARGSRTSHRGRRPGENRSTTEARAARWTQVDTRTVMRELDRVQPTPAQRTSRQTFSTNLSNLPPTAENSRSTRGNSTTNRQSRNQIFSPELRLKPDDNQSSRRRR